MTVHDKICLECCSAEPRMRFGALAVLPLLQRSTSCKRFDGGGIATQDRSSNPYRVLSHKPNACARTKEQGEEMCACKTYTKKTLQTRSQRTNSWLVWETGAEKDSKKKQKNQNSGHQQDVRNNYRQDALRPKKNRKKSSNYPRFWIQEKNELKIRNVPSHNRKLKGRDSKNNTSVHSPQY